MASRRYHRARWQNYRKILSSQQPNSYEHDEMLFVIIHQASELWMKLCLHELAGALDHIRRDDLGPDGRCLSGCDTERTREEECDRAERHERAGLLGDFAPGFVCAHVGR